jgi:hypothetical protein
MLHTGIGWEHRARARVRLWEDGLPQVAGVAAGWCLGASASVVAR